MAVEEAVYVNSEWNTRQIREMSFDLVYSSRNVLDVLINSLKELDPDLGHMEGTAAIYEAFNLRNVPLDRRIQWDRSEGWVLRLFSDLSFRHTPANLDNKILQARYQVQVFNSVQVASYYWSKELENMDQRLARLEDGSAITLGTADSAYVDSRTLRFATQGAHLVRPEAFTFMEN